MYQSHRRQCHALAIFVFGVILGGMVGSLILIHEPGGTGLFFVKQCRSSPTTNSETGSEENEDGGDAALFAEQRKMAHVVEEPRLNEENPDTNTLEPDAQQEKEEGKREGEDTDFMDDDDRQRRILPEEIRPKKLVLIGVMTTAKFIDTRAVAGYQTWGMSFFDLIYFSSEGTKSRFGLPVVGLKGIDDEYPPQRKSFSMLRYMAKHYADEYEFFMRLDDDVYLRPKRLQHILSMLTKGTDFYIGQPGEGKEDEKESLKVSSWRYCMGGPGVVYSSEVLKRLRPHVDFCLRNLIESTHEDVEVGRCLHERLGISCSWNKEMHMLFFHGFRPGMVFSSHIYSDSLRYAVTVHPLKDPSHMYRLHNYYLAQEALEKETRLERLNRTLGRLLLRLDGQSPEAVAHQRVMDAETRRLAEISRPYELAYGASEINYSMVLNRFTPKILQSAQHPAWPVVEFGQGAYRTSLKTTLGKYMTSWKSRDGVKRRYTMLNEGHSQFDPLHGYLLVADSRIVSMSRRNTAVETNEVLRMIQKFAPLVASKQRQANLDIRKPINLLVLIAASRSERFAGFSNILRDNVLQDADTAHTTVRLFFIIFKQRVKVGGLSLVDAKTRVGKVKRIIDQLRNEYPQVMISVNVEQGQVTSSAAIDFALKSLRSSDDGDNDNDPLMLLLDESVRFRSGFLQRCRLNAVAKNAVYFPAVFGLYSDDVTRRDTSAAKDSSVSPNSGTWLYDYYGVACFHTSDLNLTSELLQATPLWAEEEMAMFANTLLSEGMECTRAPDPDVYREYVPISCTGVTDKVLLSSCMLQARSRVGTQAQLIHALRDHPLLNRDWAETARQLPLGSEPGDNAGDV